MNASRVPRLLALVALPVLVCCAVPLVAGGTIAVVGGIALNSWLLGAVGVVAISITVFVRRRGAVGAARDHDVPSHAVKG